MKMNEENNYVRKKIRRKVELFQHTAFVKLWAWGKFLVLLQFREFLNSFY